MRRGIIGAAALALLAASLPKAVLAAPREAALGAGASAAPKPAAPATQPVASKPGAPPPLGGPPRLTPEKAPKGVWRYTLRVTASSGAPDCGAARQLLLINGLFQPTMEVASGDTLEVLVVNDIPATWLDVSNNASISIHWHGFHMKNNPWYDGTAWVAQCPIPRGSSFLYRFTVNEPPGTYLYHDHSAMNKGDGLQGALIVREPQTPAGTPPGANVMFLSDWWDYTGAAMAVRLNRPFDPTKVTNSSGQWCWIGLPRSVIINGKGSISDCENVYERQIDKPMRNGKVAEKVDLMNPSPCVAGSLGPNGTWPTCSLLPASSGCKREEFTLAPGSAKTFKIINAATLVYMTVCFHGHNVTVTAADARPVKPVAFNECVDVNSGQRLDVTVRANQPVGNYWISVTSQYRKGAPSAFGVLRYQGAPAGLPSAPLPQPEQTQARKWDVNTTMSLKSFAANTGAVPQNITRRFVLQTTQPLFPNGYVKWAIDNLAHADKPDCRNLLAELVAQPDKLTKAEKVTPTSDDSNYWLGGKSLEGDGKGLKVLEMDKDGSMALLDSKKLKAGLHTLTLGLGDTIEVVIQNNRAGAYGGEYNSSSPLTFPRNGREQHPFHLHGGHFWLVGMGLGPWSADKIGGPEYNTKDPGLRDTATVMFADAGDKPGWVALRFQLDNPGVWPLHCHLTPHQFMGQAVNIITGIDKVPPMPKDMPQCPAKRCSYQMAEWTPALTKAAFGNNPAVAPPQTNGVSYQQAEKMAAAPAAAPAAAAAKP